MDNDWSLTEIFGKMADSDSDSNSSDEGRQSWVPSPWRGLRWGGQSPVQHQCPPQQKQRAQPIACEAPSSHWFSPVYADL